mmetsp:Transcript_78729/g.124315  ORF Transcript_78729/g.124315 Transcript_78729/m.124315 type:complete len:134 (-) Transcript_78729:167-568(-)
MMSMSGGLDSSMVSNGTRKATGMKGKVMEMAGMLQQQNEELGVEKGHMQTIKNAKKSGNGGMQGQLNDIMRYFKADLQRMNDEFDVQKKLQEAENVRLQQQVTQLKGEKTSIHQQIIALQRRVEEIEDEMGHE